MGEKTDFTKGDLVDMAEQPAHIEDFSREALVRIVRALLSLAFRDSLTNLWNRTYFEIRFQRMLKKAVQAKGYHGCAVVLIDLNSFKLVNDTAGHLAGDDVLRKTGRALREALYRKEDVVARVGGDEFGVLLDDIDQQHVRGAVKRIAEVFTKHKVGASIGSLYCPPVDDLDGKRIIDRADKLMYIAKAEHYRTGMLVVARHDIYTPTIVP